MSNSLELIHNRSDSDEEDPPSPKPPFRRMPSRLVSAPVKKVTKAEESKAEESKAEESKAEETKKIFKDSVKLDISKDDIGRFVGAKGANLRNYVTERTQKELNEPSRIRCSLEEKGDEVFANLKAQTEEAMDTMKKFLMKHNEAFMKKKKFAGQTRFVFKTSFEHCRIAKFIGTGGQNIRGLKDDIIEEDENLVEEKVHIQIREDSPIRMKNLRFGVIKTDSEKDEMVLITVTIKTNNREESWKISERLVRKHVEKMIQNHQTDEDPFEDGGW
uniref:K Homology domain-containing protein n=1 Tax=viral metagenome TaxID=1070528 RepID=A0A6C0L3N3_9ZZZZ